MSVRASYGINFEPVVNGQGGILQAPISAPPYLQARQVQNIFLSAFGIPGPTFADPFMGDTNPFPPGAFPQPLTHLTVQDNLRPPYVQNWNLSVQRQFGEVSGGSPLRRTKGTPARFVRQSLDFVQGRMRPATLTAGGSMPAVMDPPALVT
jgi:hypothetical protein